MRTAIVSDLHLGSGFGEDLARDAAIRRVLLAEIADADRVVLLGDVLELRELALPVVLDAARPFFEELGEAMAGRRVLLVPGNHDHRLAEPVLEKLALEGRPPGLEERAAPAGEAATRIAAWLGGSELEVAYPGAWLRPDVYATHGHYMDCHMSLPRTECIAAAATMRAFGPPPLPAGPADYERLLRPIYGFTYSLAQARRAGRGTRPSERAWQAIFAANGSGGRARRAALRAALGAGIPAGIWSINRLLRAEFDADLSAAAISRSGIDAATELARHLQLDATHVLTGHTHRGGPWQDEAPWPLAGGGHLHNTGSWVFSTAFHRPGTPPGPYWPGTVTWLEDEGPPHHVRLLLDHPRDELRATVRRIAGEGAPTPA
ncbi:MAG TPA: metallophosphoesterase [Solirubrobacterales bacterium]|nr:metallophosphoesterase [Solirubrobacterales bacterium]